MFDISILLDDYDSKDKVEKVAEKVLKLAQLEKSIVEERLIYFMQVTGMDVIEWEGKSIKLNVDLFPSVLVKNHDKLKEFLGPDTEDVFSEKPSKLRAYISKRFDKGDILPEFINLFLKETLEFKKLKG